MKRTGPKPKIEAHHAAVVRTLVAQKLTDAEIGRQFGVGPQTVAQFRKKHGINKRRGWGEPKNPEPQRVVEPTVITDEKGRTVKKYPAGFAHGLEPGITARAKRSR